MKSKDRNNDNMIEINMVEPMNRVKLACGLRRLGLGRKDLVMVHSSLSKLGVSPETTIKALFDVVGNKGTIVAPAFSGTSQWYDKKDRVWDRNFPIDVKWLGAFCGALNKEKGVLRSVHPTHSVIAKGMLAKQIISSHIKAKTPCGIGSPFEKLRQLDGKILLMGVNLNKCTFMHYLEEVNNVSGHINPEPLTIDVNGYGKRDFKVHLTGNKMMKRDFNKALETLLVSGCMVQGHIGATLCFLIKDVDRMARIVAEKLLKDAHFFSVDLRYPKQ